MRLGRLLLVVALSVVPLVPLVATGSASADGARRDHRAAALRQVARTPVGSDPMLAGTGYAGDFPDPSIMLWDGTYYAYSTRSSGLNLPVLTSTDLSTWTVPAADPETGSVDAMPQVAAWADWRQRGERRTALTWAPSVAYLDGRFVATYATPVAGSTDGPIAGHEKMCISVATADSPLGPFVDATTRPLQCPPNRGAIDPQIYTEAGHVYLLYKTEDLSIGKLNRLWIRELTPDGLSLLPGAQPQLLLRARRYPSWERRVVENPALIMVGGRRYLFYSGGGWASSDYTEGYAVCPSLTSMCTRPTVRKVFWVRTHRKHHHRRHHHRPRRHRVVRMVTAPPLLTSGGGTAGPGGGVAFLDASGALRLAYHAWDAGRVGYPRTDRCQSAPGGCPQRRLHVARLRITAAGAVKVASRDAPPAR